MSEKRRGLGRGLGALIPTSLDGARSTRERPVDVFFPDAKPHTDLDGEVGAAIGTVDGAGVRHEAEAVAIAAEASTAVSVAVDGSAPATVADLDGATAEHSAGGADRIDGAAEAAEAHPEAQLGAASVEHGSRDDASTDILVGAASGTGAQGSDSEPLTSTTGPLDGLHGDLAAVPAPRTSGEPATEDDGGLVPVPGAVFAELALDEIRPNPRQPRTVFDEDALDELVGSIREIGVLQPVVVRRAGDGYELIMGERRWRAAGAAGLDTIPAIIRETGDEDLLRDALLENLHRSQLNPLEEAAAYQQLLDDFGCTHDELATRLHRSRPQVSNTLRLLKLPPLVQRRVAAGVLSAGHARALLGLADGGAIERLAQRIVAEGLSVRAVEEIVALGGDGLVAKRRAAPRAGVRNEALDALAGRLSDRFETRVKVALGKSRGRLTVEFASVQDLNRILNTLAPEDPGLFHG